MVKARRGPRGTPNKKGTTMQAGTGHDRSKGAGPQIDSRIQHEIGKHLRDQYTEILAEPVPDKIMQLLKQLEQSQTRKR